MFLVLQSFQVHPIAVLTINVGGSVGLYDQMFKQAHHNKEEGAYILNQMQSTVDASDRGRYTA